MDELRQCILKIEPTIADRLAIKANVDRAYLASVQKGVIFIHAAWSIYSVVNFKTLAHALQSFDSNARLELIVADTDASEELYTLPETIEPAGGSRLAGYGETLWIHNGKIIRALFHRQPDTEYYASAIKELKALK